MPTPVRELVDDLRAQQIEFVEFMRSASTRISGDSSRVAYSLAGHTRLTQQFFDAQRSILMRLAVFDAEAGEPEGSGADPFVERASAELAEAQRKLANLLDDWWAAVNRNGEQMLADRDAPSSSAATAPERAARSHAAPPSTHDSAPVPEVDRAATLDVPVDPSLVLPSDVLRVLERADASNLETVLASLAASLRSTAPVVVPLAVEPPARTNDLFINLRAWSSDALLPEFAQPATDFDSAVGLDDYGTLRRLLVRTVLPMTLVTAGLVAAMAVIG